MDKTNFVGTRIEHQLKMDVDSISKELGVTAIPNSQTVRAIKEARKKKGVVVNKDAKDMFKKLGI